MAERHFRVVAALMRDEPKSSLNLTETRDILRPSSPPRLFADNHQAIASRSSAAVERSPKMFKRTEEQEWTRFSKALSSRETEESTEQENVEPVAESPSVEPPAAAPAPVPPIPPLT